MLYKIIISTNAKNSLKYIEKVLLQYYPSTFSKFLKDFNSKMEILKIFPYSYPIIYNSDYRKIQLKYKYQIIYTIENKNIIISKIQFPNNKI